MARELTVRALVLGLVLALVLGAANVYLGLFAGMTVSASIPAAVISMGLLRLFFKDPDIRENNIVQSTASAGESLAAGVIFTIPALVLTGRWTNFEFWPTFLVALGGGSLGVFLLIPLRHFLVEKARELTFPERVACARVLQSGQDKAGLLEVAAGFGGAFLYKLSLVTLAPWQSASSWAVKGSSSLFYIGIENSPALAAVGAIVRLRISLLLFSGGFIAWLVVIPAFALPIDGKTASEAAFAFWNQNLRFMGVGAMLVAGLYSIALLATRLRRLSLGNADEQTGDLSRKTILAAAVACTVLIFFFLTGYTSTALALLFSIVVVALSFLFVAVAGYTVGLVGSSNSPVSGMTICALLFLGGMVWLFDLPTAAATTLLLLSSGFVCCAACTSGDIAQDLKTGQLVGARPARQQLAEIAGVIITAAVFAPVMQLLHDSYGIGAGGSLKAPQAGLFASLSLALTGGHDIPLNYTLAGALLVLPAVVLDMRALKLGKAGFSPMAVAVGMYLPLELTAAILFGSLLFALARREKDATLFASGLIAGEALAGISAAAVVLAGWQIKTNLLGNIGSLLFFSLLFFLLYRLVTRNRTAA